MENQTADTRGTPQPAAGWDDRDPALQEIVPGTMSGAEMIALYERMGAFRDYPEIGPGKKYADSTEYLLAMREEAARRERETE